MREHVRNVHEKGGKKTKGEVEESNEVEEGSGSEYDE